jgi:hypothetical protein
MRQHSPRVKTHSGTKKSNRTHPLLLEREKLVAAYHDATTALNDTVGSFDAALLINELKDISPQIRSSLVDGGDFDESTARDIFSFSRAYEGDNDLLSAPANFLASDEPLTDIFRESQSAAETLNLMLEGMDTGTKEDFFRSFVLAATDRKIKGLKIKLEFVKTDLLNLKFTKDTTLKKEASKRVEGVEELLTRTLENRDTIERAFNTLLSRSVFESVNSTKLNKLDNDFSGDINVSSWSTFHLPGHRQNDAFTIISKSQVGVGSKSIYQSEMIDKNKMSDAGPRLYDSAAASVEYSARQNINALNRVEELQKNLREATTNTTLGEREKHIKSIEKDLVAAKKLETEALDAFQKDLETFKEKTGMSFKEYTRQQENYYTNTYSEPHYTAGSLRSKTAFTKGVSDENVSMHIRGVYMQDLESQAGKKGMFISEAQSQAVQKAMGYARHIKLTNELLPENKQLADITGFALRDTGAEAFKLRKELKEATGGKYMELISKDPQFLANSIIDESITPEILEKLQRLLKIAGTSTLSGNYFLREGIVSDSITHKKDWAKFGMKQMIAWAIETDSEYLVLPIDKKDIATIEHWSIGSLENTTKKISTTIVERNSIYFPRAFTNIVKEMNKRSDIKINNPKPYVDVYKLDGNSYNVTVIPLSKELLTKIKELGMYAYRRGGLVTQMTALSLDA